MKQHFLDANVVLDFALSREPYSLEAQTIFSLVELEKVKAGISMITIPILDYFIKKEYRLQERKALLTTIKQLAQILPATQESLDWALTSKFTDLEDAIQNHIAESNGYTTIITRNKKDFKHSNLSILTPGELLSTLEL